MARPEAPVAEPSGCRDSDDQRWVVCADRATAEAPAAGTRVPVGADPSAVASDVNYGRIRSPPTLSQGARSGDCRASHEAFRTAA